MPAPLYSQPPFYRVVVAVVGVCVEKLLIFEKKINSNLIKFK